MPTKITVNESFGGEVYLSSIKKVLQSGQSVIVDDYAAQSDEIKSLISKNIIKTSSPDEPEAAPVDKMTLSPNEKFKVKNLSGRNLSVQGISEMLIPNGAIFIDYQTLVSGFIGVLLRSELAEIFDMSGNKVVLDDHSGFKKVSKDSKKEVEPAEKIEKEEVKPDKKITLGSENKISLKSASDVKSQSSNKGPLDDLATKDEWGDTIIDPLINQKQTSYVWDAESQSSKEGKPVFDYKEEDSIPDDGSAFVVPNKKLSIKSKNDVADALNNKKTKQASIKNINEEDTEEEPVTKKTTKKKKKTTRKKSKKKTSTKRKVSPKDGIDKVVDKIKNKKLSIKAVGKESKETPAEEVDDEVILHSKNESFFVDKTQETERIAKHPILRNRNNEDIE